MFLREELSHSPLLPRIQDISAGRDLNGKYELYHAGTYLEDQSKY